MHPPLAARLTRRAAPAADQSDYVCVTGVQRSRAAADNAAGPGRVLRPGG
ncbi:hypothetical protein [Micromonospora sp. M71_S20]|nr:hypothetical protein [Micromonospora sp. M71_S20]